MEEQPKAGDHAGLEGEKVRVPYGESGNSQSEVKIPIPVGSDSDEGAEATGSKITARAVHPEINSSFNETAESGTPKEESPSQKPTTFSQNLDTLIKKAESTPSKPLPAYAQQRSDLPSTCHVLTSDQGPNVFLVGTAHFSKESQEDVAKVIQTIRPNVVMLELCPARTPLLTLNEDTLLQEAKTMNFSKVQLLMKQKGVIQGVMNALLLSTSAKITEKLGMAPGGEFRRAFNEAKALSNCYIWLGDRPVDITVKRAIHSNSVWKNIRLAWELLTSDMDISSEDIEKLKNKDLLEELMGQLVGDYPHLSRVFVQERDQYMVHVLRNLANSPAIRQSPLADSTEAGRTDHRRPVVVAVVGMGHVPGMIEQWEADIDTAPLLVIPEPPLVWRGLKLTVRVGALSLFGWLAYKAARKVAAYMR